MNASEPRRGEAAVPVVVLAAGSSRRFGEADKLLADVDGRPLLDVTLGVVVAGAPQAPVLVAVRPGASSRICELVGVYEHARIVEAAHAERGMGWTLRTALSAVEEDAPGAVMVLADDPLAALDLAAVLDAASRDLGQMVAVQRDRGLPPHPVYAPRRCWPQGDPGAGAADAGLRGLLAGADVTWVRAGSVEPVDVDVPEDVSRLAARSHDLQPPLA